MKKMDYSEFESYFDENLAPKIKKYENIRKILFALEIIIVLMGIFVLYVIGHSLLYYDGSSNPFGIFGMFAGGVIAGVVLPCKLINWIYSGIVKVEFYKMLFMALGLKYSGYVEESSPIKKVCDKSGIFNRYNDIFIDEALYGDYVGIHFNLYDVEITYGIGSTNRAADSIVFKGIFISAQINKNFNGETLIKTDKTLQTNEIMGKKVVKLEDVEFEKEFEVYGSDQVETRYLLTTAFMNRLLEYKRQKNIPIEVVISNKIFEGPNIFFFIHTNKNHFEIPITASLLNKKVFYEILTEIIDALEIIETMKLEQNIGL